MRPMGNSPRAMEDLNSIFDSREAALCQGRDRAFHQWQNAGKNLMELLRRSRFPIIA